MKQLLLALLAGFVGVPALCADSPAQMKIAYDKYTLPNGLDVILVEDHRLPLVAVNLWYHVGAVNERIGRTGFAHLFEHMMFQGTKHVPADAHFRLLEGAGATVVNGTTNFDRTNYFETLPSNQLELALWLESDRMGFLLETLDQETLANQRDVVRNERRQSIENPPYVLVGEAVYRELFPKSHPYHAFVIGSHADIEAARLRDVREFFKQYYTPNNASLVIVGDIDKARTRALVEKYFGPLRAGAEPPRLDVKTAPLTAQRRVTVTDKIELPAVYMAWLTAPLYEPGDAEADMLATVLGGGKSSRLYKRLVYERKIAQDVSATQESMQLTSVFFIEAKAKPGVKLEDLERAIDEEIATLRAEGPLPAEVERARNSIESALVDSLDSITGVADRLNTYNHYLGDPGYLSTDLNRYGKLTPAALKTAAQAILKKDARLIVYGVPGDKRIEDVPKTADEGADETAAETAVASDDSWRSQPPAAAPPSKLTLPVAERFQLANGLTVYAVERHQLPIVSANLVVLGGREKNPSDRPGLAAFTADMLDEGTRRRSALQIADDSARVGTQINIVSSSDASILAARALTSNADAVFGLLADVTLNPAFDTNEIDRVRNHRLTELLEQGNDPNAIAGRTLMQALYGAKHPYGYLDLGTKQSLQRISREEIAGFWKSAFTPDNAALIVAGDLSVAQLRSLAEKHFGGWQGKSGTAALPGIAASGSRRILVVDKAKSPQTALFIGQISVPRADADYVPLQVLNIGLGGTFSSRINMNLREKNGYTYGARSQFTFRRGPGPFIVNTSVRTDATAPAIAEIFSEVKNVRGEPFSAAELERAKELFARSLPGLFDTSQSSAASVATLFIHGLPLDYYSALPARVESVTAAEVKRVAEKHVNPERMVIVAVGDRATIEPGLKSLNLGSVQAVSAD
jgi:zinc protease